MNINRSKFGIAVLIFICVVGVSSTLAQKKNVHWYEVERAFPQHVNMDVAIPPAVSLTKGYWSGKLSVWVHPQFLFDKGMEIQLTQGNRACPETQRTLFSMVREEVVIEQEALTCRGEDSLPKPIAEKYLRVLKTLPLPPQYRKYLQAYISALRKGLIPPPMRTSEN